MKIVYTCITGKYDEPKAIIKKDPRWRYIMFTDQPGLKVPGWEMSYLLQTENPGFLHKFPKLLPHQYLPEHEVSIWIDGSFEIIGSPEGIYLANKDYDMCLMMHPKRSSVYDEADEVLRLGFAPWEIVNPQITAYKEEGFPGHYNGKMYQCGIMIRKPTEKVNNLMEAWLKEIGDRNSRRDQLSLPYILWKNRDNLPTIKNCATGAFMFMARQCYHNKPTVPINYLSPWGYQGLIGKRINEEIERIPDHEWICLTDQDTCVLIDGFGNLLSKTIQRYPDTALFGAYTNRIGLNYQKLPEGDSNNFDMLFHHDLADKRLKRYYSECTVLNKPVAGFFMLFSKEEWKRHHFQEKIIDENKVKNGIKGIYFDYGFGLDVLDNKGTIRMMEGNYLYHHYRVGTDNPRSVEHLLHKE